ncbi:MAG: putative motility protein, partial [Paenibacillaceae bacterium]|nr:putative motility protein [Paenibacillaceae bacterium]
MDIAAMSMQLSSSKIQQSAGLSVAKKAMDNQE